MNDRLLPEDDLIHRAVGALFEALGPVEASRFLNLARSQPYDAVEWHRRWQSELDQRAFFDDVFDADNADSAGNTPID